MPSTIKPIFEAVETHFYSLGDDVQRKDLKLYIAFKRLRNFATLTFHKKRLMLYLHLDPDHVNAPDGLARDVRNVGHWGTGDLEISLANIDDLKKAMPLIRDAYDGGSV